MTDVYTEGATCYSLESQLRMTGKELDMRKRNNTVHIQMNDNELDMLKNRIKESNKSSIQSYALDALLNGEITDGRLIEELTNTNKLISDIDRIEKGIGINVNQIAKKVNTYDIVLQDDIDNIKMEIDKSKQERNELWQLTRLYLQKLKHTRQ